MERKCEFCGERYPEGGAAEYTAMCEVRRKRQRYPSNKWARHGHETYKDLLGATRS